jgi:hypothetical protein
MTTISGDTLVKASSLTPEQQLSDFHQVLSDDVLVRMAQIKSRFADVIADWTKWSAGQYSERSDRLADIHDLIATVNTKVAAAGANAEPGTAILIIDAPKDQVEAYIARLQAAGVKEVLTSTFRNWVADYSKTPPTMTAYYKLEVPKNQAENMVKSMQLTVDNLTQASSQDDLELQTDTNRYTSLQDGVSQLLEKASQLGSTVISKIAG